jgi:predicted Zn-dependent protease
LRGQAHLEANELAQAISRLQQAVTQDATDEQAHYQLAQAYLRNGQTQAGNASMAIVEELRADYLNLTNWSKDAITRPWDAEVRRRLAEVCRKLQKPDLARMWEASAKVCEQAKRPQQP